MRLLPLFLFALGCRAQIPVIPLPQLQSSAVTPASIASIRYWWRFEDNPTNVPVTNWLDRIASLPLTNAANSVRPTNSSVGVGFNGTTYLTNTSPFSISCGAPGCISSAGGVATNGSLWVIVAPQSTGLAGMVCTDAAGGQGLFTVSTRQIEWFGGVNTIFGNFQLGAVLDIAACLTNSGSVVDTFYTNGVQAATSTDGINVNGERWVGSRANALSLFNGKILDIAYFTNYLTPAQITTLHTYAMTRGVTP